MGQRINYFKNKSGETLKNLIIEHFPAFRLWYLEQEKSSREVFDEPYGNETFRQHLIKAHEITTDLITADQQFIDELTATFVTEYLDILEEGNLLASFGPALNKWRYDESTEMILQTEDKEFIQLWHYIIKGRSLKNNDSFNSYTNDPLIGFLSFEEYLLLQTKIESCFGNLEQIKRSYWSNQEQWSVQNAIQNSENFPYTLVRHNPKSAGLESVLQVLNEIKSDKHELVIVIT